MHTKTFTTGADFLTNLPFDQTKIIKKRARRETSALAALLLSTTALSYLLYFAASFWKPFLDSAAIHLLTRCFSFSITDARLFWATLSESEIWTQFFSMAADLITFFLPFALFSKYIAKRPFDEVFPFCGGRKIKNFIAIFGCQMLMANAASLLCSTIGDFVAPDFFANFPTEQAQSMSGSELLVYFLSLCVFTPFVEEFVFRGAIFGTLRKYGFAYAAVASALLFGLAHGGPSSMAYAFASGFAFAAVYEITGSIRYSVLLHAINNTVSFLFGTLFPQFASDSFIESATLIYDLFIGALGFWGFVYLLRSLGNKKMYEDEPEPEKTSVSDPSRPVTLSAFFSVGTVFYILLFLYNTVLIYNYGY